MPAEYEIGVTVPLRRQVRGVNSQALDEMRYFLLILGLTLFPAI
jgi:hypothetical protein